MYSNVLYYSRITELMKYEVDLTSVRVDVTKPILSFPSFLYILVIITGTIFIGWFNTITFSEGKIETSTTQQQYQFKTEDNTTTTISNSITLTPTSIIILPTSNSYAYVVIST